MISRVGHLLLKLKLPHMSAAEADAIRTIVVDTMLEPLLEAIERMIHARLGREVIVRVHRLPVRWQLAAANPALVEELAGDVAAALLDAIASIPEPERLRPSPDASLVIFESEAHLEAVALAALATASPVAWFHPMPADPHARWREIAARGADAIRAVLSWLIQLDVAEASIAAIDDATLAALVETADPVTWPDDVRALPRVAVARALVEVRAVPIVEVSVERPDPPIAEGDAIETRCAGAVYLVGRLLELDLAEHLWCAGFDEGAVIARVLASVAGDERDPLPRWLAGCFSERRVVAAPARWSVDEVLDKQRDALGRRLVRWQIETTPEALERQLEVIAGELDVRDEPETARLIGRLAAGTIAMSAARLGEPPSVGRLRALIAVPGRAVRSNERLVVALPMHAVDLDVRRAGLDTSPGWVPWLQRSVAIEFAPGPDDAW